ncbi:cytochrome P450 [Trichodelitschia bisporula]|uniref:Cytochrome P450 n=1 Tax=Trichodelitschia bisporula TaxID=703511 RepID=A0A6G1HND1_9PEZI|nr:cytochrome P450 [Trichodelitschia bisporula]
MIFNLALLALAYWLYTTLRAYLRERQFRAFARQHNCAKPYILVNKLPWGLDGLYRTMRAAQTGLEDIFDDVMLPRFRALGVRTFEATGPFGIRTITTMEPRIVQAALATQFKDFETGERRAAQFGAMLGRSIFTSDGAFWAHSRAVFRPAFAREQINDFEETDRAARILIDVLPKSEGQWTAPFDLQPYLYRFTMDTATAFLFGNNVESQLQAAGKLEGEKSDMAKLAVDREFTEAFHQGQMWLAFRIRMQGLYWLVDRPYYRKAVARVRGFVNRYVQMALDAPVEEKSTETNEDKAHKKYALLRELVKESRDPIYLRDQILALLGAGRDTTAALLSWVFYLLATHPTEYHKLRRIIISEFGPSITSEPLDFGRLKSCRQLQYVINETLRLYPVVPINNRVAVRNTTLPVGGGPDGTQPIAVRKGQTVTFIVYGMHRREDLWGENAGEFLPGRWEGLKRDWAFLPFSGGPRICLGQQYAITEASYLIVRLLQQFDDIEWCGAEKMKKGFTLTMFPGEGVNIRFRKAAY